MHKRLVVIACTLLMFRGAVSAASQSDSSSADDFGTIRGRVIDAHTEKALAKAKVVAEPNGVSGSALVRQTLTDEEGNFTLDKLVAGVYIIAGAKEGDGYPNSDFAAFASDLEKLPRVSVQKGKIIEGVVVRLDKGGRLVGEILDSIGGKPLLTARIRLSRADNPALWLSTGPDINGHFEFALPDRPFRMEVTAPGYRAWTYGKNGSQALKVEPDTEKRLSITLQQE